MEIRKLVLLTCLLIMVGEAIACLFLAAALPKGAIAWTFAGFGSVLLGFMAVIAGVERFSPPPGPVPGQADGRLRVYVLGTAGTFIVMLSLISGLLIGLFRILGISTGG